MQENAVIPSVTANSIYEVPLLLEEYKIAELIAEKLNLGKVKLNLKHWKDLVNKIRNSTKEVKIALVGKYTGLDDAYLSVIESLKIACFHNEHQLKLIWISAEKLEEKDEKNLGAIKIR